MPINASLLDASGGVSTVLCGYDAGDLVTVAIFVRNIGAGDAYDVRIRASGIPEGFEIPSGGGTTNTADNPGLLSLCVSDGHGRDIAHLGSPFDDNGMKLLDPGVYTGSLRNRYAANGDNLSGGGTSAISPGSDIAVVSFLLVASNSTRAASSASVISAGVSSYASAPGAPSKAFMHAAGEISGNATAMSAGIAIAKATNESATSIDATGHAAGVSSSAVDIAIGEAVSFNTTVRIPEGITPRGLEVTIEYPEGTELLMWDMTVPGPRISFVSQVDPVSLHNASQRRVSWTFANGDVINKVGNVTDAADSDYLIFTTTLRVPATNSSSHVVAGTTLVTRSFATLVGALGPLRYSSATSWHK